MKNLTIIVYIICDDNYTWDEVIKEIPLLDNVTIKKRFILANGFNDVKNKVATILTKYKDWLKNPKDTVKKHNYIHYFSRDWNKTTQNEYLEKNVTDLKLNLIKGKTNDYEVKDSNKHLQIFYLDKNEVSTDNNYIDQLPTVRSIRESIKNPKWMNPFLINRDHFKSLMTKIKFPNTHDISIQAGGATQFSNIELSAAAIRSAELGAKRDDNSGDNPGDKSETAAIKTIISWLNEWIGKGKLDIYKNRQSIGTVTSDIIDSECEIYINDSSDINVIPNEINKLRNLEILTINDCKMLEQLPERIDSLISLNLYNNGTNPLILPILPKLNSLNLEENINIQLLDIPSRLPMLKSLTIKKCPNIKGLPVRIDSLEELNLDNTGITTLPILPNLKILRLEHSDINQLLNISDISSKLPKLEQLYLSNNEIADLSELLITKLSELPELKVLDLSNNKIAQLPDSLSELAKLKDLNLSNNQITNLPETFNDLTNLTEINLSNNKLTSYPKQLDALITAANEDGQDLIIDLTNNLTITDWSKLFGYSGRYPEDFGEEY